MTRRVSVTLLVVAATTWASLLVIGGLFLTLEVPGRLPILSLPSLVAGVTAIAGGQLVFTCCVADRIFPKASRMIVSCTEIGASIVVFGGLSWLVLAVLAIYGGLG